MNTNAEHLSALNELGYGDAKPLGAGMEGAVYGLTPGRVAKLWFHRTVDEVLRIQSFYHDVAQNALAFATPQIFSVTAARGLTVSIERELQGTTLRSALEGGADLDRGMDAIVQVLAELRTVSPTEAIRNLPLMDERDSPYVGAQDFATALNLFVDRRVNSSAAVMKRKIPHLNTLLTAIKEAVVSATPSPESVIHGDLIPDNVLVADDLTPVAVLDFGFMSTGGASAFDAAIASATFEMYSAEAAAVTGRLQSKIESVLQVPRKDMVTYLAAYGLATATAYDSEGNDGHFAWCVERLNDFAMEFNLRTPNSGIQC